MTTTSTPADRKVRDILVRIIETMHDESQRELARDLLLTLPAVRDWPHDTLRAAYEPFSSRRPARNWSSPQQWQAGEPVVEVRRGPARRPQVCPAPIVGPTGTIDPCHPASPRPAAQQSAF